MKLFRLILTVLAAVLSTSEGFKVLGVFATKWKSHWNVGASVLKQLAMAGHDVTFVSPFELKLPNVQNVILTNYAQGKSSSFQFQKVFNLFFVDKNNAFDLAVLSPTMNFLILPEILEKISDFTLSHPNVQKLMNNKYDVVIVEAFHSEVLLGKVFCKFKTTTMTVNFLKVWVHISTALSSVLQHLEWLHTRMS